MRKARAVTGTAPVTQANRAGGRMVDTRTTGTRIARERARDPELRAYLQATDAHPLLTAAEEKALAKRVEAGDTSARRRLIECNVRLVVPIAACYTDRGMSLLELISYGNIGLCEAADSYDYRRGRFTTHASWLIRNAVSRSLANLGDTIRISRSAVELHKRLRALEAITGELSDKEAAYKLSSTVAAVKRARVCREETLSLSMVVSQDNHAGGGVANAGNLITLGDTIPDTSAGEPEEAAMADLDTPAMRAALARNLATLSATDREIIRLRFASDLSYPEIGERLGTSREAIRRATERILATLRAGIEHGGAATAIAG